MLTLLETVGIDTVYVCSPCLELNTGLQREAYCEGGGRLVRSKRLGNSVSIVLIADFLHHYKTSVGLPTPTPTLSSGVALASRVTPSIPPSCVSEPRVHDLSPR